MDEGFDRIEGADQPDGPQHVFPDPLNINDIAVVGAPVVMGDVGGMGDAPGPTPRQMGDVPLSMHCPYCKQPIITEVHYRAGCMTWLACGGLTLVGCVLCCCLLPFCLVECQNVDHVCPGCQRVVAIHKRI